MSRKNKYPEYPIAGRPPKEPETKIARPVRALVTMFVFELIEELCKAQGINLSEFLRLAIYNQMRKMGEETQDLMEDPTFDTLREKGLL
jgi:hypothetical protein